MGKKWVCLLKSVGKVESNEVFCGAVEEEEGGEKLVEKKKKTNHVMVVLSDEVEADDELEVDFNVMDQPDDLTLRYDRYRYSAPIAVTAALCRDQSGAMTAIGTARRSLALWRALGLIGTICSKWPYRLISYPFKMKKYALYSS
ncbi:hypothetical protein L249_5987 [Ophiocordyceps polyrhachis-furcata BCC 54312]|uniref:Uncharacterized protein n=1 Tax=Ophiocordyceps polyrhachis-furcata BCC 54312 TaxID=1330021 RepID=A0A367LJ44_9HYPO|nr:hypothetical protein L249_5987 [Ophiocordyceps polyrhachis-furcata BCC 54312]